LPGPPCKLHQLLRVPLPVALVLLVASPSRALVEPDEREMRGAYVLFLKDSLASQGKFADPNCNVAAKGCSVVLLDMRRDYKLVAFKKRECRTAGNTVFVCLFDAKVTCVYSAQGKPNPDVADLYCGPLYNKTSAYTALFHYQAPGWVIQQFVQG
jgi:hypothetical protein